MRACDRHNDRVRDERQLWRRLQSVARSNDCPSKQKPRKRMHVLTQFVDQLKLHLAVEEKRITSLRHLIHDLRHGSEAEADPDEDRDEDQVLQPLTIDRKTDDPNLCMFSPDTGSRARGSLSRSS